MFALKPTRRYIMTKKKPYVVSSNLRNRDLEPLAKVTKAIFNTRQSMLMELFWTACFVYLGLLIWGISFLDETDFKNDPYGAMDSFLHYIALAFHEAGHLIFRPFGQIMHALGGTIAQCLIPICAMVYFIRKKEMFEASVCMWWLGFNFMDVAPYIYDAFDKELVLLGGITGQDNPDVHDWHFILTKTQNMQYHDKLAQIVADIGKHTIIISLIWGGVILLKKRLFIN